MDDHELKSANRQIAPSEKIEKKIIKSSNTSQASKNRENMVNENKISVPSESPQSNRHLEGGNSKISRNEQLGNLNSSLSEDQTNMHDLGISPKQNNKNQIVREANNISYLQNFDNKFQNQLIMPIKKTERIFETKTKEISQPTIKVNIGRIEVRAIMETKPQPPQRQITRKPNITLEDYLKRRDESKS
jgi:hypothetical protein